MEESVKADVFLMGSFQYTEEANDIDLILIYSIANYDAMKRLKDVLAEAIYDTFNIPVHYTTLSENEYEEMYALRNIKQYLLAALYNAPLTISNYYQAMYNNDHANGLV